MQPLTTFFGVYFAWVQKILLYEEQNVKPSSQYRGHVLKTTKKPLNFCASVLFLPNPDAETVHDNMYQMI